MEELELKKRKINDKIQKHYNKIYKLEQDLIEIEKDMSDIKVTDIIKKMELNPQQKRIVESDNSKMLVIACPGSGKTHTLISRVIHLILNKKVDPDSMILITFTNKAGKEMEERLNDKIKKNKPYYIGSLHGLGFRLLQEYKGIDYTVIDVNDSRQIIQEVFETTFAKNDISDEEYEYIGRILPDIIDKSCTKYPPKIDSTIEKYNLKIYKSRIKEVITNYEKRKQDENLIDFNDLMVKLYLLLSEKNMKSFLQKIKYVFFDEYQDINPIQQQILDLFSDNSNIMVVGDDAQAIYSFRGSSVEYIWDFQKKYKDAKKFMLETNYRSSPRIIKFCQNVIENNTKQFQKNMISSQNHKGILPCLNGFSDREKQYNWIINDIKSRKNKGMSYNKMVILSRTNKLLDHFELYLFKNKIPFQKNLGKTLLEKTHIKDFLAFAAIVVNPKSKFHWKRIIGLHPKVGVSKASKLVKGSTNIVKDIRKQIKKNTPLGNNLVEFYDIIKKINKQDSEKIKIVYIKDYLIELYKSQKVNNLKEIIIDIDLIFNYLKKNNIANFIAELYLNIEAVTKDEDGILLTTIHRAKGLEWDNVYIIDVTCQNFPYIMPKDFMEQMDDVEEERRLFYVGSSRSKKFLNCTFCYDSNSSKPILPSPFLREIKKSNYIKSNVDWKKIKTSGNISNDINNYLRYIGYSKITPLLNNIDYQRKIIHTGCQIPFYLKKQYMNTIIGNFFDLLIAKMIQINFPDQMKKFDLKLNQSSSTYPPNLYNDYVDPLVDWRNIISKISAIASFRCKSEFKKKHLTDWVTEDDMMDYYEALEDGINKIIDEDVEFLDTHFNLTFGKIRAEADVVFDQTIIEIKSSNYQICSIGNVLQGLIYCYLSSKKNININKLMMYNPLMGEITTFNSNNYNLKEIISLIYPNEEYLYKSNIKTDK